MNKIPWMPLHSGSSNVPQFADFHDPNCLSIREKRRYTMADSQSFWSHFMYSVHMLSSARAGCSFCEAILNLFQQNKDFDPCVSDSMIQFRLPGYEPFHVGSAKMGIEYSLFPISGPSGDESCRDSAVSWSSIVRRVQADPDPSTRFRAAEAWLQDCCREHELCRQRDQFSSPSRLLQIGTGDLQSHRFRVVASQVAGAQYAALSHCWGDSSHTLKSLKSNIDTYEVKGIHWDQMPKTFQDAIVVAQALGISYLWIDSLCIIQDDRLDWEKESALMKDVYEAATVVIAAMSAPADDHGFLIQRQENSLKQYNVGTGDASSVINIAERIDHECIFAESYLSRRGWTFQERLVAKRILSFTDREMTWECNTAWHCECGLRDLIPRQEFGNYTGHTIFSIVENADWRTLHRVWRSNIVKEYSRRAITKDSDKLPAISAIANVFQQYFNVQMVNRLTPITYAAGLWYDPADLDPTETLMSLLWVNYSEDRAKVPPYRAPSWSWTSLDVSVSYFEFHVLPESVECPQVSIQKICCPPLGEDPTGEVAEGSYIVIKGRLSSALRIKPAYSDHVRWVVETLHYCKFAWKGTFLNDCSLIKHQITSEHAENTTYTARRKRTDESILKSDVPNDAHVWCLHIAVRNMPSGTKWCYSLVLGKLHSNPDKYCRLGVLTFDHSECQHLFQDRADEDLTEARLVDVTIL